MHELSFVSELLTRVQSYSTSHTAKEVTRVHIAVSKLSGIEPVSFRFYWKMLTQDTLFKKTKLSIRTIPGSLQCVRCTNIFLSHQSDELIHCPVCGSIKTMVKEDTSVVIKKIEIED